MWDHRIRTLQEVHGQQLEVQSIMVREKWESRQMQGLWKVLGKCVLRKMLCAHSCINIVCVCLLFEKQRTRQRQRGIFHLLVHYPEARNSQGWVLLKPGAQNSSRVPQVGGRDPATGAMASAFPGVDQQAGGVRGGARHHGGGAATPPVSSACPQSAF